MQLAAILPAAIQEYYDELNCVFMAGYAYEKELFAPYFEKLAALND